MVKIGIQSNDALMACMYRLMALSRSGPRVWFRDHDCVTNLPEKLKLNYSSPFLGPERIYRVDLVGTSHVPPATRAASLKEITNIFCCCCWIKAPSHRSGFAGLWDIGKEGMGNSHGPRNWVLSERKGGLPGHK